MEHSDGGLFADEDLAFVGSRVWHVRGPGQEVSVTVKSSFTMLDLEIKAGKDF